MSDWTCPLHSTPARIIPAGVSKKTYKPYPAFEVCSTPNCNQKPPQVPLSSEEPLDNAILMKQAQEAIRNAQDKDRRIQRQHSQEMALRFTDQALDLATLKEKDLLEKVKEYTDIFEKDLELKE